MVCNEVYWGVVLCSVVWWHVVVCGASHQKLSSVRLHLCHLSLDTVKLILYSSVMWVTLPSPLLPPPLQVDGCKTAPRGRERRRSRTRHLPPRQHWPVTAMWWGTGSESTVRLCTKGSTDAVAWQELGPLLQPGVPLISPKLIILWYHCNSGSSQCYCRCALYLVCCVSCKGLPSLYWDENKVNVEREG